MSGIGKQGLLVTRDPGRVMRPGDPDFPGDIGQPSPKQRVCVNCHAAYTPTSNAQKRCPACQDTTRRAEPAAATASSAVRGQKARAPRAGMGSRRSPKKARKAGAAAARRRVPAAAAAAAPARPVDHQGSPTISVEAAFNAGLLVRLLRAAATCLEALDRGEGPMRQK